jgi:hypothetical protein
MDSTTEQVAPEVPKAAPKKKAAKKKPTGVKLGSGNVRHDS